MLGIVDKYQKHNEKPLCEHLDDFKQNLLDNGNTIQHAETTFQRAKDIIDNSGFIFIKDVQPSIVSNELSKLKREKTIKSKGENGKTEKEKIKVPLSISSKNYYLKSLKQFFNWMISDRRTSENPIAFLKTQNAKTDIKRKRRALSENEFNHLLEITLKEPKRQSLSGEERVLLYLLAAYTGLRAGEIASLCWNSFIFDSDHPTVTVSAAYSKHRKDDVLPLRPDIAEIFLSHKSKINADPKDKVFKVSKYIKWAELVKKDLEKAKIPYIDDMGRVFDFHSFRHTFITNLSKSGVSPKVAQRLARHSKITLTLDVYTHCDHNDQRSGLEALPVASILNKASLEVQNISAKSENAEKAHTKRHTKCTGKPDFGSHFVSQPVSDNGIESVSIECGTDIDNSLEMSHLCAKKEQLSSIDNSCFLSEADENRTRNLWIDSPML